MRGRFAVSPSPSSSKRHASASPRRNPVAADRHLRPTRERSAGREDSPLVTKRRRRGDSRRKSGPRARRIDRDGRRVTHARDPRRRARLRRLHRLRRLRRRANFGRRTGIRRLISSGDSRARRSRRARRARAGASVAAGSRTSRRRSRSTTRTRRRRDASARRVGIGIVALFCLGVQRRGEIRVRAAVHHARRRGGREPRKRAGRRVVGVESRRVRQRTRKTTRQTVAGVKRAGDRRRRFPVDVGSIRSLFPRRREGASAGRDPAQAEPEVAVDFARVPGRVGVQTTTRRSDGGDHDGEFRRRPGRRIRGGPTPADAFGDGHGRGGVPGPQKASGRGIVETLRRAPRLLADVDEGVGAPQQQSPLVTATCAVDGGRGAGSRTRWWSWR